MPCSACRTSPACSSLARALAAHGVELVSTGGTARSLREAGIAVREVSELTGFPEIMDGRVKTLHPKVHGALLGPQRHRRRGDVRRTASSRSTWWCVNLYPFEQVAARARRARWPKRSRTSTSAGPAMLRAAAKNHARRRGGRPIRRSTRRCSTNCGASGGHARGGDALRGWRWRPSADVAQYDAAIATRLSGLDAEAGAHAVPGAAATASCVQADATCATARTRTRRRRSIATCIRRRAPLATLAQLQGKELPTTTSSTSTPPGSASREFDAPGLRHRQARQSLRRAPGAGLGRGLRPRLRHRSESRPSAASSPSTARSTRRRPPRSSSASSSRCIVAPGYDAAALAALRAQAQRARAAHRAGPARPRCARRQARRRRPAGADRRPARRWHRARPARRQAGARPRPPRSGDLLFALARGQVRQVQRDRLRARAGRPSASARAR